MTDTQWDKLKPGDEVVAKRAPGIVLVVIERNVKDGVQVKAPHGEFWLRPGRHSEFSLHLPQERLPL